MDEFITDGEYDKAARLLEKISDKTSDRYSCYRVIKRSINLGEITGDFTIFKTVSEKSRDSYPGNEDIQAYYVMSLLKTGNYEDAHSVAIEQLHSQEFKPLLAQAILYRESSKSDLSSIKEYINSRKDPSFFEYLANILGNRGLYINSALLWANNGEIEKAFNLVNNLDSRGIEELKALLAYDSGRLSASLSLFLDLPESESVQYDNILMLGDLFYMKENYPRSRFYYEKALELGVLYSAPYINITSIYLLSDNIKQAIAFLEKGISDFNSVIERKKFQLDKTENEISEISDIEEIKLTRQLIIQTKSEILNDQKEYRELVLLLHHLYNQIRSPKAVRILEDYRRLFKDDVKVELLYLKENSSGINPDIFTARLWDLLNRDIDSREVSEFLVWYLLGIENYRDIELVIERSEHRHPEAKWTDYYRGIVYGLTGEYDKALEKFNSSDFSIDQWEILYNKGVIKMANQEYPEALILLNKSIVSINQLKFVDHRERYLSLIKTKIGQVLLSLNDMDEAIRVLNSAYELDKNNYTSDLLKSVNIDLNRSKGLN